MKLTDYNDIIHLMRTYKTRESLPVIAEKYPGVSINTLGSIFSQDYQKKMRKTHYIHYSADAVAKYYDRFVDGLQRREKKILINLSEQMDLSPALLGRIILERHISLTKFDGETPPKSYVTQLMKEPSLIEDPVLSTEVHQAIHMQLPLGLLLPMHFWLGTAAVPLDIADVIARNKPLCILADEHYGPLCDAIKHSIGHEYEFKLNHSLDKLGMAYIGEDQMRQKGYDKTPDVKLEIPIAVDGHVVNWIESKASFGDEHSHKTYLKDQFWSYWNRFGPGMVIYWFGFIDELDVHQDKGIILRDHFPENIVKMDPTVK